MTADTPTPADVSVRHFDFVKNLQRRDLAHRIVKVTGRGRDVEVALSPTGRSVQVFVDGKQWKASDDR